MVPRSAPDPRFQKGPDSALSTESRLEQRSPLLEVAYVVALLLVFFVGLGLVVYFASADKATANMQPDPIPAKEPKSAWKVVGIGACLLTVGLGVLIAGCSERVLHF
jgi:hypothetical protein